jgi:hypothetical protein
MGQLNIEVTFVEGPKKGQIWIHKNLSLPDIFEFYDNCTLGFIRETDSFVFDDSHKIELSEFMYTVIKKIDPSIETVTDSRKH